LVQGKDKYGPFWRVPAWSVAIDAAVHAHLSVILSTPQPIALFVSRAARSHRIVTRSGSTCSVDCARAIVASEVSQDHLQIRLLRGRLSNSLMTAPCSNIFRMIQCSPSYTTPSAVSPSMVVSPPCLV